MERELGNELNEMTSDMLAAIECYQPSRFWKRACDELANELDECGIDRFRSTPIALRYFVPTYGIYKEITNAAFLHCDKAFLGNGQLCDTNVSTRIQQFLSGRTQAFSDYRTYLASLDHASPYTDKFSESSIGNPIEQFEFDNRLFSRSSLNYLLGINYFKKTCGPESITTVMEIGGGFGSLGEIFLSDVRNKIFYIDIDIPPTAYVATYYLQSVFDKEIVGDYQNFRNVENLDISELKKKYSAVVFCPWQLPKLVGDIDLFVNYISFQEMEPDVVENYLRHVRRLNARFILLRNLREGKQIAVNDTDIGVKQPIFGGDYDRFLPGYSLIDTNTVPFGFETEDGFHSELRMYRREDI